MTVNRSDSADQSIQFMGLHSKVLGFAAFSGTGKTTLLCRLIPLLRRQGLRLGLIKHSHHVFEVDRPGKDSYQLRHAGAEQVVVASAQRTVVMAQHQRSELPGLSDFLRRVDSPQLDLILVEGYKYAALPKIELHRPSLGHPLLALNDPAVIAVASDETLPVALELPILDLNQAQSLADFILARYHSQ